MMFNRDRWGCRRATAVRCCTDSSANWPRTNRRSCSVSTRRTCVSTPKSTVWSARRSSSCTDSSAPSTASTWRAAPPDCSACATASSSATPPPADAAAPTQRRRRRRSTPIRCPMRCSTRWTSSDWTSTTTTTTPCADCAAVWPASSASTSRKSRTSTTPSARPRSASFIRRLCSLHTRRPCSPIPGLPPYYLSITLINYNPIQVYWIIYLL